MLKVNTIFFDVDGTIVDATKDIANAVNFALESLGRDKRSYGEIISCVGTGVSDLISKSLKLPQGSPLVARGVELYGDYYMKHSADEARLYPNAKEILEYFSPKRKFVLTNRYRRFAEKLLEELDIAKYFEDMIGGDDETCIKPSKCLMDKVLPRFKVNRDEAIIVGDMDIDVMTGKNSGIRTCFITHGLGRVEDVRKLKPDYIIDDLIELKKIIK